MQKRTGLPGSIARGVLIIGFCVQVVMGLIWMVLQFAGSLAVGESLFCVQGSELLAHLQCLIQVVLAGYAAYDFLGVVGLAARERKYRIGGALVMVTFPMAMQCHMSLGGESLLSSLLLLQTAMIIRLVRNRKKATFGGIVLLMIAMLAVGFLQKEERPLIEKLGSRLAWSSLNEAYGSWPAEVQAVLPAAKVREATHYADGFSKVLVPYLEELYGSDAQGTQQVKDVIAEITRIGFARNTKGIVKEIAWDGLGYLISPVVVQLQLAGYGYDSCTGVLYDNMRENYPLFGGIYMNYGCDFWVLALLVTVLVTLFARKKGERNQRIPIVALLPAGVTVLWYTLRGAGMMDYRKTIVVVLLCLAWVVCRMSRDVSEPEERKEC